MMTRAAGGVVSVVIADDNAMLRYGIRAVLESSPAVRVLAEARSSTEAAAVSRQHAPDVLLLGVHPPGLHALDVLPQVDRATGVIVLTSVVDAPTVLRAVSSGARGYLVHGHFEQQQLLDAVIGTAGGHAFLSPPAAAALLDRFHGDPPPAPAPALTRREHEVMELIAAGLTNSEIAARLVISGKTVKNHVHHVYKRLKVDSREQAVTLWRHICPEPAMALPGQRGGGAHESESCLP